MLFHLAHYLTDHWSFFNVIHYVSTRAMIGLLSALGMSLLFGSRFIGTSKRLFASKPREWTPDSHRAKAGIPTMGGLFIIAIVGFNTLLWCNLTKSIVWLFLLCLIGFAAIGLLDDWRKIKRKKGISAQHKFLLQVFISLVVIVGLLWTGLSTSVTLPFFKNINPHLGLLFIVWGIFIMVGFSNGVNLTDGLDGLAIGSLIPNFALFGLICFLAGHAKIAHYLNIPFAGSAELSVICSILVGASLGFLWYNTYPAQIFMGDVGSLALGAALAFMGLASKQELLLAIAGGLFVIEAFSVILQVFSYRYYGRRLFKMAPIHHHFELLGWPESKITARFGIISLILCLIALITLKLR